MKIRARRAGPRRCSHRKGRITVRACVPYLFGTGRTIDDPLRLPSRRAITMARIFLYLATLDSLALLAAFGTGFVWGGDPNTLIHFHLGLWSVVLNLGVHCLIFIYFLGTGRWVKEVALAYELPDQPWPKLTRELKRRTFPPALAAMLISIAAAAAGMGAMRQQWPPVVHLSLAVLALVVNAWAFWVEYRDVVINGRALDAVLTEVDRIRRERGLPANAEALAQEE